MKCEACQGTGLENQNKVCADCQGFGVIGEDIVHIVTEEEIEMNNLTGIVELGDEVIIPKSVKKRILEQKTKKAKK